MVTAHFNTPAPARLALEVAEKEAPIKAAGLKVSAVLVERSGYRALLDHPDTLHYLQFSVGGSWGMRVNGIPVHCMDHPEPYKVLLAVEHEARANNGTQDSHRDSPTR